MNMTCVEFAIHNLSLSNHFQIIHYSIVQTLQIYSVQLLGSNLGSNVAPIECDMKGARVSRKVPPTLRPR